MGLRSVPETESVRGVCYPRTWIPAFAGLFRACPPCLRQAGRRIQEQATATATSTQRNDSKVTAMNKTATQTQTRRQRRLAARRSRSPAAQGAPHFRLKPLTALVRATLPVTLLGLPAVSLAGPEGGVVTAGSGTVARPDAADDQYSATFPKPHPQLGQLQRPGQRGRQLPSAQRQRAGAEPHP